jgi:Bacterial sugar transferase
LRGSTVLPLLGSRSNDYLACGTMKPSLSWAGGAGLSIFSECRFQTKLDSPGPASFRQRRSGLNHAVPDLLFRTMSVIESGAAVSQATRHDPRVTRVGRVLRLQHRRVNAVVQCGSKSSKYSIAQLCLAS